MSKSQWERAHKIAEIITAADIQWTNDQSEWLKAIEVNDDETLKTLDKSMTNAWNTMAIQGVKLATIMLELGPVPAQEIKMSIDKYPPSHPGFARLMASIEQHDPLCAPDDSLIGAISPEQQRYPVGSTAVYDRLRVLVTIIEAKDDERLVTWKQYGCPFSSSARLNVSELSQGTGS